MKNKSYNAKHIVIQTDRESARSRVATYLGSASSVGLHHCIWEVVDNSIDEAMAGFCTEIKVTLHKNGYISVEDNGRGIPVDIHPEKNISALRVLCTSLHSGGKMDNSVYKTSGGLNGMGLFLTVACSEKAVVEVSRDGKLYYDEYENGFPVTKLTAKGGLPVRKGVSTTKTGTKVYFKGDSEVFECTEYKPDLIKKHLHTSAYLNSGVSLIFINENTGEETVYHETEGIVGYIKDITKDENPLFEPIHLQGKSNNIEAEIALQYIEDGEVIISYTNSVANVDGGEHETGFKSGFTKLINNYVKDMNYLKGKETSFKGKDVRFGMIAIISLKHPSPQFEGQTKTKLGNTDAKYALEEIIQTQGALFFDRNLECLNIILENASKSMSIRNKTDKIKSLAMSKENQLQTNGKLAACLSKKTEDNELFIVEGDSAGGTAKTGRNRKYQAILPLRGKVLNVEKSTMDKSLANKEIQTIILALGCGYGNDFDISKLKYNKVIIMTDADVDGHHIRSLLMTLFYKFMPELIQEGHLYKAIPPLYKITSGKGKKESFVYAYSDRELEEIKSKTSNIKGIQRYKGLGEMSAEQLWETTMNPETRTLAKIAIDDIFETSDMTKLFMGPKADRRKELILNHGEEFFN